jgi:tRNA pseudouridine32 synthase/23S rRNA pseudouridine746 synthase
MTTRPPYIVPPCNEHVDILFQDEDLLFVNKPSGLLSVPGRHPANQDCVLRRIEKDFSGARMVHRLDMDTSGIMVVALTLDVLRALNRQFEKRETLKEYQAVVYGIVENDSGFIELPLICDWPNRPRQMVDHDNGKYAYTKYKVILRDEKNHQTRVLLKPTTGRSHQLRVHLSAIGHPILGCEFYAHQKAFDQAERLLLHATTLQITHPTTNKPMSVTSPSPFR